MPLNQISFITVCKGRLEHLKKTLPLVYSKGKCENIIVDWDCPDGCANWVKMNYSKCKVLEFKEKSFFDYCTPKNEGAKIATKDFLCFLDADVILKDEFFEYIDNIELKEDSFYVAVKTKDNADHSTNLKNYEETGIKIKWDLFGFIIVPKNMFLNLGGYDSIFRETGGEDKDLRFNLILKGKLNEEYINVDYFDTIRHSDELREKFQKKRAYDDGNLPFKEKWGSSNITDLIDKG